VVDPIVASVTPAETAAVTATTSNEEAAKKAFEEAVKQKLQQELAKLQAEYTRELQKKQSKNAPIVTANAAPPPPAAPEERPLTAAQLDQLRREAMRQAEETQPPATTESAPQIVTQTTAPALTTQAPVPAPVVPVAPVVREGDIVDGPSLDVAPRVVRAGQPVYPPVAARQRITGTVLVSALISERGDVVDVKILKAEGRMGFDDAAVRAVRSTKFSPAMKDGKRVKTWIGIPIQFKP
jgi:TonB family protein